MSLTTRKKVSTLTSSSSLTKLNTHASTNNNNNRKKNNLTKPGWDSTNSNLEQFKSNEQEIERRKMNHQSKNLDLIKTERQRQSILKSKKQPQGAQQLDSKVQLALLKEILFDDDQFKNILLKSDVTLKNAANIIENDNLMNKKTSKINFTSAPNHSDLDDSILPQESVIKNNNKINIQNLNNSQHSCSENNEKLTIDELIKYRQYLIEKKNSIESQQKGKKSTPVDQKNLESFDELEKYLNSQMNNDMLIKKINEESDNQTELFDSKTINDTNKINRIKSRIQNDLASQSNQNVNLNDFKKVLEELENQIIEYEEQTGRSQQSAQRISKYDTFSSYTVTLVNAVSSLLHHLKNITFELQNEKQKFNESKKQIDIQRKLIDCLTSEVLTVKTQNEKIINQFTNYQAKMEYEIDQLKLSIRSNPSNYESFNGGKLSDKKQAQNNISKVSNSMFQQRPQIVNNEPLNDYDKFSERLNAMLLTDIIPGTIPVAVNQNINNKSSNNAVINKQTNNKVDRPSSSLSRRSDIDNLNTMNIGSNYYDFDSFLSSQQTNGQPVNSSFLQSNSRPTSAQHMSQAQQQQLNNYNSNTNSLLSINKQIISEFNSQIQDLSVKNFETQQKLKNFQNKQEMNGQIDNEFALKFPETANFCSTTETIENNQNQQTLNKLKYDQQQLKEQILMLNKQREMAQKELNKIVTQNNSSTLNAISIAGVSNNNNRSNSPNLSPIPTEAIFTSETLESNQNYFMMQTESEQLDITPPLRNHKIIQS